MGKRKRGNSFGKWLIFCVAMLFMLYGAFLGTLLLFGEDREAILTSYRQEYGERNEVIPNRYTYLFGYKFTVEGKTYHGTGQRVASPVFLKPTAESTISIRYLPCCPYLNSHVEGNGTWKSSLIFLWIGVVLLLFFRRM